MYEIFTKKVDMAEKAMEAKFIPSTVIQFLIFVGVFIVAQIIQAIVGGIAMIIANPDIISSALSGGAININSIMERPSIILISLFATIFVTGLSIIYCRFIERRSLYSMGFGKKNALSEYSKGLLIGFIMFASSVLICVLTGTLEYKGYVLGGSIFLLILFFLGFVIQGMSEEVFLRGYFMISLMTKRTIIFAVLANSVIFSLMHMMNSGITPLSVVNLILFGIFASFYTLKANNIWGICALHSIWNFAQGNIFGILVSGMKTSTSVFSFESTTSGSLINGGTFGLEGGLAVTFVLLVSTAIVLIHKKNKTEHL